MKKRILLLASDDYSLYVLIEKNLKWIGFDVTTILPNRVNFRYKNFFQRLTHWFRKLIDGDDSYKRKLKEIHITESLVKEIDSYNQFDYCLVIRADFFHPNILYKAKEKSDFIVSYHYDGLRRNPSIYNRIPIFDRFYVFDEEDLIADGQIETYLSHNFYFDYNKEQGDSLYDVYFLGYYAKSREQFLFDFLKIAKRCLESVKFQIVFSPENIDRMSDYEKHGIECLTDIIPFNEYLKKIERTKFIVDFVIGDHKGLSFRVFEGIKYQKKVITTNTNIIKYDFYTPNNFYVLDHDTLDEKALLKFVNTPYRPIDESIRLKYSFSYWIKDVLNME